MRKVLSAIFVFVALCLIVAIWTLKDFDKNIRLAVIEQVAEKTGRSVSIDGEVKTIFSFSPSVQISDIKLSNASWSKEPYMAQIGDLEIKIDPLPLFQRKVEIERLSLKNVSLNFEVDAKGQKNWLFLSKKQDVKEQAKSETPKNNEKKYHISTKQVIIEAINVSLNDEQKEKMVKFQVDMLNVNALNGKYDVDVRFAVKNQLFDLKIESEAQNNASSQYAFLMDLKGEKIEAKAKGNLLLPFSDVKLNAEIEAKVNQLSFFNAFTDYSFPDLQNIVIGANIDLSKNGLSVPNIQVEAGSPTAFFAKVNGSIASVKPLTARFETNVQAQNMAEVQGLPLLPVTKATGNIEINQGILLDNLNIKVGESDLSGRILVQTKPNTSLQVHLQSSRFNLGDVLWKKYQSFKKPLKKLKETKAPSASNQEELLENQEDLFEKLKAIKADINIDVKELIALDKTKLGTFNLKTMMQDGVFYLPETKLSNLAQIQAKLDASKRPADVSANLNVNNMPLTFFFEKERLERGTVTGNVQFTGRGNSKKEIYSSLNGRVFVNARDVYFNSFQLIKVSKNIPVLSKLNREQPLSVSCAVINVPIINGLISEQKKIGIESDLFTTQVNGDISLANEEFDLKVLYSPQSESMSQVMFSELLLQGPFNAPTFGINKEKAFDRALSLGLAFFTGGKKAAQETLKRQMLKNVCAEALAKKAQ